MFKLYIIFRYETADECSCIQYITYTKTGVGICTVPTADTVATGKVNCYN